MFFLLDFDFGPFSLHKSFGLETSFFFNRGGLLASCSVFGVKIPGDGHPYLGLTGSLLKEYAVEAAKKDSK